MKEVVDDLLALSEKYGEALGQQGKAIDSRIKVSRPAFFRLHATSSDYVQSWNSLSKDLDAKDLWYLEIELQAVRPTPYPNYVDGGIRPDAYELFEAWVDSMRKAAGPRLGPYGSLGGLLVTRGGASNRTLLQALDDSESLYDRYRVYRDWVEFAAQSRNITDDPELYARYVIALARPWVANPYAPPENNFPREVNQFYDSMVEVYGKDPIIVASTKLMSIPKNLDGSLNPSLVLYGRLTHRPFGALNSFVAEANLRNLTIDILYDHLSPTALRLARDNYNRMIVAYGQDALWEAAKKVSAASKDESGRIKDPESLGTDKTSVVWALNDLAKKNSIARGTNSQLNQNQH